jgi:hypothetical protein
MKRFLAVVIAVVVVTSLVSAQSTWGQGLKAWGGGLELSLPTGDLGNVVGVGVGPFAKFQYGINEDIALIGSLGYTYWTKKTVNSYDWTASAVPLLVGAKYNLSKQVTPGFYGFAEIGFYFFSTSRSYGGYTISGSATDFVIAPGVGYEFGNFDASLKYVINGDVSDFAVRIAYQVPLH